MIRISLVRAATTIAAFACVALAHAQAVTVADVLAIHSVIYRQMDALRRGNAGEAFLLTSPGIRQAFKTPENFMRDVRNQFTPLIRPSALAFSTLMIFDDDVIQQVRITDESRLTWSAHYPMQRQKDGSWRTNGCRLVRNALVSV